MILLADTLVNQLTCGFGKPPDRGIMSGGAAASSLVISLMREGWRPADTALINLEYIVVRGGGWAPLRVLQRPSCVGVTATLRLPTGPCCTLFSPGPPYCCLLLRRSTHRRHYQGFIDNRYIERSFRLCCIRWTGGEPPRTRPHPPPPPPLLWGVAAAVLPSCGSAAQCRG